MIVQSAVYLLQNNKALKQSTGLSLPIVIVSIAYRCHHGEIVRGIYAVDEAIQKQLRGSPWTNHAKVCYKLCNILPTTGMNSSLTLKDTSVLVLFL